MMRSRIVGLTALVLTLFPLSAFADPPIEMELIDCEAIWHHAHNNSLTDMVRFRDKFYVCLREKDAPVPGFTEDGNIRVIRSAGGSGKISDWTWESVAYLDYKDSTHPDRDWDDRDPTLSVTPDDRLLLITGARPLDALMERQSVAWFSDGNGETWTDGPHDIGEYNWWMWGAAWHPDGTLYGAAYGPTPDNWANWKNRLYRSEYHPENANPLDFQVHVSTLLPDNASSEAALLFRRGGDHTAVALVRRGGESWGRSWVGTAEGDYTEWTWNELSGRELGGQDLLELPDGSIIAATRYNNSRTSVCWLDPEGGELVRMLDLPNGVDGGYCGLVWQDGFLWVSYYGNVGGHGGTEGTVYLAKVAVTMVPEPSTWIMLISGLGLAALYAVRRRPL